MTTHPERILTFWPVSFLFLCHLIRFSFRDGPVGLLISLSEVALPGEYNKKRRGGSIRTTILP